MASSFSLASLRCCCAASRHVVGATRSLSLQSQLLAGHNKWSKIGRSKAIADKKHASVINKFIAEINVAVKEGGGTDPSLNSTLAGILQRAKAERITKTVLDKAIARAASSGGNQTFEVRSPLGFCAIVEVAGGDISPLRSAIKSICKKYGNSLAETGSTASAFHQKGFIVVDDMSSYGSGDLLAEAEELAIEIGAEDFHEITNDDGLIAGIEFVTESADVHAVARSLKSLGVNSKSVEQRTVANPDLVVQLSDEDMEMAYNFLEALEEDPNVINVIHNVAFSTSEEE